MIVPIFLYAHTQQVEADFGFGSFNSSNYLDAVYWSNATSTTPGSWKLNHTAAMATAVAAGMTDTSVSCNIYWPENDFMNGQAAFTLYTFTLAFAIPLILILVFYILVIRKLQVGNFSLIPTHKKTFLKFYEILLWK